MTLYNDNTVEELYKNVCFCWTREQLGCFLNKCSGVTMERRFYKSYHGCCKTPDEPEPRLGSLCKAWVRVSSPHQIEINSDKLH